MLRKLYLYLSLLFALFMFLFIVSGGYGKLPVSTRTILGIFNIINLIAILIYHIVSHKK